MFFHTKSSKFAPFVDTNILALPGRDYGFRLIVPKTVGVKTMKEMGKEQTWSNFKHEAANRKLTPAGHTMSKWPSSASRNDMSSKVGKRPSISSSTNATRATKPISLIKDRASC